MATINPLLQGGGAVALSDGESAALSRCILHILFTHVVYTFYPSPTMLLGDFVSRFRWLVRYLRGPVIVMGLISRSLFLCVHSFSDVASCV